jgi:hypothetical protein
VPVYRRLLVLYPRSFRRDYGEPMAQLFADRVRDRGRARAWAGVLPDLLRTIPKERIEALMTRLSPNARVLIVTLAAAVSMFLLVVAGGGVAIPAAVTLVVVAATQRRHLRGLLRGSARAPFFRSLVQAWWTPVAVALAAFEILFALEVMRHGANLPGRFIGGGLALASGLGIFNGLMRRPFERAYGNVFVLLGTLLPLMIFWMLVPPLAAIVVWVGVFTGGFGDSPVVTPAA